MPSGELPEKRSNFSGNFIMYLMLKSNKKLRKRERCRGRNERKQETEKGSNLQDKAIQELTQCSLEQDDRPFHIDCTSENLQISQIPLKAKSMDNTVTSKMYSAENRQKVDQGSQKRIDSRYMQIFAGNITKHRCLQSKKWTKSNAEVRILKMEPDEYGIHKEKEHSPPSIQESKRSNYSPVLASRRSRSIFSERIHTAKQNKMLKAVSKGMATTRSRYQPPEEKSKTYYSFNDAIFSSQKASQLILNFFKTHKNIEHKETDDKVLKNGRKNMMVRPEFVRLVRKIREKKASFCCLQAS